MALVLEKMNESDMRELAEKIAATYMNGRACDTRQFIETFLDVCDVAIGIIRERENKKIAAYHNNMSNLSLNDLNEKSPKSVLR